MARINMEADEDEILPNGQKSPRKLVIEDISLDKQGDDQSKNGFSSIQFSCIKEPRHEFFSSLKRKQRLMVFGAKKIL